MRLSKAKVLILAAVVAGVVGGVVTGLPVIADSQLNDRFVQPLENAGFTVEYAPIELGGRNGFLGLGSSAVHVKNATASYQLNSVGFGPDTLTFDSSSLTQPGRKASVHTGPGKMSFVPGKSFHLKVAGVELEGSRSPLSNQAGLTSFDFSADTEKTVQGLDTSVMVRFDDVGEVLFSSVLKGVDLSVLADPDNARTELGRARVVRAGVEFKNLGGFESFTEQMAKAQGIPPEQTTEFLKLGISGSAIPASYREVLVNFIEQPEVLSAQIAPGPGGGEGMTVDELREKINHVISHRADPLAVLNSLHFQLVALPN